MHFVYLFQVICVAALELIDIFGVKFAKKENDIFIAVCIVSFFTKRAIRPSFMTYFLLDPVGTYVFKVNNRNTRTRCKICSKLTIKTPE